MSIGGSMKDMNMLAIWLMGLVMFSGTDYTLFSGLTIFMALAVSKKMTTPCKVYDFMEYKQRRDQQFKKSV
jgi:hypothetical protein